MNRNYIIAFGVSVAVLAILAYAAWALFETEPYQKWVPPSREARRNEYLALDRWLESSGIPVRTESSGNISTFSGSDEKHIFIQASLFRWDEAAIDYITDWINNGGNLFLVLDYNTTHYREDDEPYILLEKFGISVEAEFNTPSARYDGNSPGFYHDISFHVSEAAPAIQIKDWTGSTRLVQAKSGKGTLTVSGRPRFIYSHFLESAPNMRLAWTIFLSGSSMDGSLAHNDLQDGWLFIRGITRTRGLLGSLWQQGNLTVLLVSVIILLVICFWAVLPNFGLIRENSEKPGKALRERFLAEGRFLKSYGALNMYIKAYIKEIKRRLARKEGLVDNELVENRLLEILGNSGVHTSESSGVYSDGAYSGFSTADSALLLRALRGENTAETNSTGPENRVSDEHFSYQEFTKMVIISKTILERI